MRMYSDICQVVEIQHGLFGLTLPYRQGENLKISDHNGRDINLPNFIVEITPLQFGVRTGGVSHEKMEQLFIKAWENEQNQTRHSRKVQCQSGIFLNPTSQK